LITLGGPRVNEAAVVKAINNVASGVPQYHAAFPTGGKFRAAEPLVGYRRPMVAGGRDRSVTHNCVDGVVFGQGPRERDPGAERLDWFVARVSKGCRRLEADPQSPIAEGKVGSMVEFERSGQAEARALIYDLFIIEMRLGDGRRKVHARAGGTRGTDGGDCNRVLVRQGANAHPVTHGEAAHPADFDIGRAGASVGHEPAATRLCADARDCDGLDPVAHTVDVEPDFVTDLNVVD
jgi:hypothetical protein